MLHLNWISWSFTLTHEEHQQQPRNTQKRDHMNNYSDSRFAPSHEINSFFRIACRYNLILEYNLNFMCFEDSTHFFSWTNNSKKNISFYSTFFLFRSLNTLSVELVAYMLCVCVFFFLALIMCLCVVPVSMVCSACERARVCMCVASSIKHERVDDSAFEAGNTQPNICDRVN